MNAGPDEAGPLDPTRPEADGIEDVLADFLCRREGGENPAIEDYQARYPRFAEDLARLVAFETVPPATKSESSATRGGVTRPDADADARTAARGFGPFGGLSGVAATEMMELESLPRLGPYEILAHVSTAGGGTVYRARDTRSDMTVALKTLDGMGGLDARDLERFRREAAVVRALDLVNVVPVLDAGHERGRHYIAMRWIDGETLRDVRTKVADPSHPLHDRRERARLVAHLARTFAAVHGIHVVHRDVKPSNIMLDRTGAPMLIDFGIARSSDLPELTETGDVRMGTPRYLAPEIVAEGNTAVSPAVDIYGLGLVLYELATGVEPFAGVGRDKLYAEIAAKGPVLPRRAAPDVPFDLEAVILRAIEPDPRRRYPSMDEFADDLERFARGEPPEKRTLARAKPLARLWARRRGALLAAAVVIAAAAYAGTWFWSEHVRPEFAARAAEAKLLPTAFFPPDATADGAGQDAAAAEFLARDPRADPARRLIAAWAMHVRGRYDDVAFALANESSFAARLLRSYALAVLRQDEDLNAVMSVAPGRNANVDSAPSEILLDRDERRRFALGAEDFNAAYAATVALGAPRDAVDHVVAAALEWSILPTVSADAAGHAVQRIRENLKSATGDGRTAAAAAYLTGGLALLDGRPDDARPAFLAAASGRDLPGVEYLAACCLVESGRAEAARVELERVHLRLPGEHRVRLRLMARLAESAAAAGDIAAAEAVLADALRLPAAADENACAMLHAVRGEIAFRRGDLSAAIRSYGDALEVRPVWGPGYDRAAALARLANDEASAAAFLRMKAEQIVISVPADVETYLRLEWRGLRPPDRAFRGAEAVEVPR